MSLLSVVVGSVLVSVIGFYLNQHDKRLKRLENALKTIEEKMAIMRQEQHGFSSELNRVSPAVKELCEGNRYLKGMIGQNKEDIQDIRDKVKYWKN